MNTTKYILHGGYANHINEDNDRFFREIMSVDRGDLKILLVYFAKEADTYEEVKKRNIPQFEKNKGEKNIAFEIAVPETFAIQASSSDIIYLHGGETLKLLDALEKYENLTELFKGKTVAGESAGAYVLSAYFYSKTVGSLKKGLNMVPVKTICHYQGENKEILKDCSEELPELLLPDYKYKVF